MTRRTIRTLVGAISALAAAAMLATPAAANAPSKTPKPGYTGPVPGFTCVLNGVAVPIAVDLTVDNEVTKTFSNPPRMQTEGSLRVQLTATYANNTSQTLNLNISGPGEIVQNPDGTYTVTSLGNSIVFVQNADGSQTILASSGRFQEIVPVPSTTVPGILTFAAGRQMNICSLFSPPAS